MSNARFNHTSYSHLLICKGDLSLLASQAKHQRGNSRVTGFSWIWLLGECYWRSDFLALDVSASVDAQHEVTFLVGFVCGRHNDIISRWHAEAAGHLAQVDERW